MSFPINYSNGSPNYAYNGATVVIPAQPGGYGVLELEALPNRNLYVGAYAIVHGPDCQVTRLFSSITPSLTLIDDNLVEFPLSPVESLEGVFLTTGKLRFGTTTTPPGPQEESFITPSMQMKPPVSDVTVREFTVESFRTPLFVPPKTVAVIRSMDANEEIRLAIRWFEQARAADS